MARSWSFVTGDAVDPTAAASEATRLATREGVKIDYRHVLLHALRGGQRGGVAAERHLLGDVLRRSRLTRRGAQERVPDRDRRHRIRRYNVEFIAKHLAHRLGKKPNESRLRTSRGFLVRPERDRDRAPSAPSRNSACRRWRRVLHVHHQRPDAGDPQAQERQTRHPAPHRAQLPGRHPLLAEGARAGFQFKALVHAGATGYGSPDFGKAFGNDARRPFRADRARAGLRHRGDEADGTADRARVP